MILSKKSELSDLFKTLEQRISKGADHRLELATIAENVEAWTKYRPYPSGGPDGPWMGITAGCTRNTLNHLQIVVAEIQQAIDRGDPDHATDRVRFAIALLN
jgi:hypothetical protein